MSIGVIDYTNKQYSKSLSIILIILMKNNFLLIKHNLIMPMKNNFLLIKHNLVMPMKNNRDFSYTNKRFLIIIELTEISIEKQ